ncbi:MAG TPA: cytochrome c oxidase subunit II [Opitutaceae bacterium]|nr:cytochrome c oxidase subunit II [Opitutaceae bacterium]
MNGQNYNARRRSTFLAITKPAVLPAVGIILAGCGRAHSALSPVSPEAADIARIWWIFFVVCAAVYIVVALLVVGARWCRGNSNSTAGIPPPLKVEASQELRTERIVLWATVVTALILVSLLGADLWVQRGISPRNDDPLAIRLTGHQWWWSAEYQDPNPSRVFETANEIHIPAGRSIRLILESNDVIHSFWIPQIHGKKDLIPGHPAEISFRVDKPGKYDGFCAEFCGYQHAHMGLIVVAEEPAKFEQWAQAQRTEAPPSLTDSQKRGREIFEHASCSLCHTANGTMARSRVGPILTHVASRSMIGAGVLPNTRENLAAWLVDPQIAKPGAMMPPNELSKADLNALLDFMETLK